MTAASKHKGTTKITASGRRQLSYFAASYFMLRGWDEGYEIPSFGACTHPELRGAGLGQLLLAHAIAESRAARARSLRLTVYKDNEHALHIYRKFGFVFSEKNERELVGLLDLGSAALFDLRAPDRAKLEAWRWNSK